MMKSLFWVSCVACLLLGMPGLFVHAEEPVLTLQSAINGKEYSVQSRVGTAGILGTDNVLGFYFGVAMKKKWHGFGNRLSDHLTHFCEPDEPRCFITSWQD